MNIGPFSNLVIFFILLGFISCKSDKKDNLKTDSEDSIRLKTSSLQILEDQNPSELSFKMKLWQNGIDFYARGNEPSWAIDIDFDKSIKFINMEGKIIEASLTQIDKAQDVNITRISGSTDSEDIIITISDNRCEDSMSGEQFTYAVKTEIIQRKEDKYVTYQGCGQYVPEYGLHDIWILTNVNEKEIDKDRFPNKGMPRFEFFVEEGRVGGHAGCNNFNGGFYRVEYDMLEFDQFATTRMICSDMKLEEIIIKSVAGQRMKYRLEGHTLILSGYDGTVIKCKKVD
jgi:heat shock protein HslJ/uncharacterized membrane protein